MSMQARRLIRIFLIGLLILVILVVINQLAQLYGRINALHPILGTGYLLVVLVAALLMIGYPVFSMLKLPKALELPKADDVEAAMLYRQELIRRLNQNSLIREAGLPPLPLDASEEAVQQSLNVLNRKTRELTKRTASQVFITTAISQNGSLDGLFVLVSATKMVWQIAAIYNQRPNLKALTTLYLNVAATVLLAREIDDLDLLDEQLEPVFAALFGTTLSSLVPGATLAANLVLNSIIEGSANAFLTLRVGLITEKYVSSLVKPDRRIIKRNASLEACGLLAVVIKDNGNYLVQTILRLSKRGVVGAFKRSSEFWKKGETEYPTE
ncbi:MAG: DUF697 domain-containing protein [Bacillota bacterium]|nr:DUF697 domain-containing protein [Bacillota bacterium]MDW7677279.1 DUF697 domain-containing protein [Bacillota bacterium]